ncbi:hypothetical protein FOS14_00020 [Skermania sp. ID1734]|uniref:TY-Chap domain-containing protein n=1 Tax=Skermania sp. ID1734 TaxID=2597516 RepID=UPI001180FD46|nr:hypothetical protein [Skermania sp. ID1734]TSE01826.1 hypothetical protein FOS14_00020 [Skermania sp. ID1734]
MTNAFDFDASVEQAWVAFRGRLADDLAELQKGGDLVLELPGDQSGAVRFKVTGANRLRCEVWPAHPLSQRPLDGAALDRLIELGWRPRRSGLYVLEVGRRWVDKMAAAAVILMRELWNVPHPTFIDDGKIEPPAEPSLQVTTVAENRDHLMSLVHSALQELVCDPLNIDEDGDIRFDIGGIPSWLRVRGDEPTIEFFAMLSNDATDPACVCPVIMEHSRQWPDVKLLQIGESVYAVLRLASAVFAAKNLQLALEDWLSFMGGGAPAIVKDLAERPTIAELDDHDENPEKQTSLPPALSCLLQLDLEGGSLSAREVATICEHSRDGILEYIRICSEQELSWLRSADEAEGLGDHEEAAACQHEARAWKRTTASLRAALRVVVLPEKKHRGANTNESRRASNGR